MRIAETLRGYRLAANMSIRNVERTSTLTRSYLSKVECGLEHIDPKRLLTLLRIYKAPVDIVAPYAKSRVIYKMLGILASVHAGLLEAGESSAASAVQLAIDNLTTR